MNKKDIYEHLAEIYLDASSKSSPKAKKNAANQRVAKQILVVTLAIIGVFVFAAIFAPHKQKTIRLSELSLILTHEPVKINFNFDPAKKEIYSLNLANLDVNRFKTLGFTVKKANFLDKISLRVEFTNSFNERSEIYIKDIPHKWKDYQLSLFDFKKIADWSKMKQLAFIVEEWNTREKNGVVYIDNVRLMK